MRQISTSKPELFYPNPTSEILYIKNSRNIDLVTIYTILGKKLETLNNVKNTIDVSKFPKGIYIINYKIKQQLYTTKFIKH